jgi:hypothetical protein
MVVQHKMSRNCRTREDITEQELDTLKAGIGALGWV